MPFFDPYAEIRRTTNRLPHWEQTATPCFVTFRLADSLPESLLTQWDEERAIWMKFHPEPWDENTEAEYHKRFSLRFERWLDEGHGSCILRSRPCAEVIAGAFQFFNETRYIQISWVVMPNHAHVLFVPHPDWSLEKLMHSWKSWSSKQLKMLVSSHPGPIWQKDYRDRLIRDSDHFARVVRYIRNNPIKARLGALEYLFWESDLAKKIE